MTEARHYRIDRDGVCLLKHATSAEVQEATGFSGARIWTCAAYGGRMGGIYDIWFDDRDTAGKEGEFGEKEARRKFGDKNYEEWCKMNRRYGKKEQSGI